MEVAGTWSRARGGDAGLSWSPDIRDRDSSHQLHHISPSHLSPTLCSHQAALNDAASLFLESIPTKPQMYIHPTTSANTDISWQIQMHIFTRMNKHIMQQNHIKLVPVIYQHFKTTNLKFMTIMNELHENKNIFF